MGWGCPLGGLGVPTRRVGGAHSAGWGCPLGGAGVRPATMPGPSDSVSSSPDRRRCGTGVTIGQLRRDSATGGFGPPHRLVRVVSTPVLHGLAQAVCADETFVALTARLASPTLSITAPDAARPFAVAALAQATRDPLLVVSASGREAEDLVAELAELLDDPGAVALFPSWETLPHERLSPSADTVGQRLAVLHRLAAPAAPTLRVVVTTVRSVVQPMAPGLGTLRAISQTRALTRESPRSLPRYPWLRSSAPRA